MLQWFGTSACGRQNDEHLWQNLRNEKFQGLYSNLYMRTSNIHLKQAPLSVFANSTAFIETVFALPATRAFLIS